MSASVWEPNSETVIVDPTLRNDLLEPNGGINVGYTPDGIGAVPTNLDAAMRWDDVNMFAFMTAAQIFDVEARTRSLDVTLPCNAAVAFASILGGRVVAPDGDYKVDGVVTPHAGGADGFKTGILIPYSGTASSTRGIQIWGTGTGTCFVAGSDNMVVIRSSRTYVGGGKFRIDGDTRPGTIGMGMVPESMVQITEAVTQSYQAWQDVIIENCYKGAMFQPGPEVGGSASGCFYMSFSDFTFNLCTIGVHMVKDITNLSNRSTRVRFTSCRFLRGNVGAWIEAGTEIDFYSPYFEFLNTGVSPLAIPTGLAYVDPNPANIQVYGGYAEQVTRPMYTTSSHSLHLFGWYQSGVFDASFYAMGMHILGRLNVAKLPNTQAYVMMGGPAGNGLVADPDQNGQKSMAIYTNGVEVARYSFNGSYTHKGTGGNTVLTTDGKGITFTGAGTNTVSATDDFIMNADRQYFRPQTGAQTGIRIDNVGTLAILPEVDNATAVGLILNRFSQICAANGVIVTSDADSKNNMRRSPLGLKFILKLEPLAYKFNIGGRTVEKDGNGNKVRVIDVPGKRQHFGFAAQQVKEAAGDVDFGGHIMFNPNDPKSEQALRYDEFIAPIVCGMQEIYVELTDVTIKLKEAVEEILALKLEIGKLKTIPVNKIVN